MELRTKKMLDWYMGGVAIALLKPWVWLFGRLLRRDHTLRVRDNICFIKMLGGGSLIIAYPALVGLRQRYPEAMFSLICARGTRPFAESLEVFDRIDTIDDSSLFRLVCSSLCNLWRNLGVDTVVDLEVYSRLTTVVSILTCARNRLGFYLESVFWRKPLYTHLIFFNRSSGSFRWYDAVACLLGAEPVPVEECQQLIRERFGPWHTPSGSCHRIAIGHACSELGGERMLNAEQWLAIAQERLDNKDAVEILLLGSPADRELAAQIIETLRRRFPSLALRNFCGELSLQESLRMLATCQEFWGIDSALLHYARLLGLQCTSFWGPTDPATRLRPVPGLHETVHYSKLPCSPCIHVAEEPPCQGNNVCIQSLFHGGKDYDTIFWLA